MRDIFLQESPPDNSTMHKLGEEEPVFGKFTKKEVTTAGIMGLGGVIGLLGKKAFTDYMYKDMGRAAFPSIRGATDFNDVLKKIHTTPVEPVHKVFDTFKFQLNAGPTFKDKQLYSKYIDIVGDQRASLDPYIKKHKLKEKGVRINILNTPFTRHMSGPSFNPFTKEINLTHVDIPAAAHELGHAKFYSNNRVPKIIATKILPKAALWSIPIAFLIGDEIRKAIPGTVDDKAVQFVTDNALSIAMGAVTLGSLYPEAKASIDGYKHLNYMLGDNLKIPKSIKGKELASKLEIKKHIAGKLKRYKKFMGSQIAVSVIGAIPILAGTALAQHYFNKDMEKQGSVSGKEIGQAFDRANINLFVDQAFNNVGKLFVGPEKGSMWKSLGKHFITKPSWGTYGLVFGLPAAIGSYIYYGSQGGKMHHDKSYEMATGNKKYLESKKNISDKMFDNPATTAFLVGIGATLAGGLMRHSKIQMQKVI